MGLVRSVAGGSRLPRFHAAVFGGLLVCGVAWAGPYDKFKLSPAVVTGAASTLGPYKLDTDTDGIVDVVDTCPALYGFTFSAADARRPECFLGSSTFLGPVYTSLYNHTDKAEYASTWKFAGCEPGIAYRFADDASMGGGAGVVVVGRSITATPAEVAAVEAAILSDGRWPDAVPAACLLSIDYEGSVSFLADTSIATAWARAFLPAAGSGTKRYGLGLLKERTEHESREPMYGKVYRSRFSRAGMYTQAPTAQSVVTCTTGKALVPDPTKGGKASQVTTKFCTQATGSASPAATLRIVPWQLDDALLKDASAALGGKPGTPLFAGVPQVPIFASGKPTGSKWYPLFGGQGYVYYRGGLNTWNVVPREIALHGQLNDAKGLPPTQTSDDVRPAGSALYSVAPDGTRLVMQRTSRTRAGEAASQVITLETVVPRPEGIGDAIDAAASSEKSEAFGSRWRTNYVSPSCWLSPQFPSKGAGKEAAAWCPKQLQDWWKVTPEANAWDGGFSTCNSFHTASEQKTATIRDALANPSTVGCAAVETAVQVVKTAGCCVCDFVPSLVGQSVCCEDSCVENVTQISEPAAKCVFEAVMNVLESNLPADKHWVYLGTPAAPNVPFWGVMRSEFVPTPVTGPNSGRSFMTYGDAMFGFDHQGNDWNWSFAPGAIDPLFRVFVQREREDGSVYVDAEHEIEFQIPMGRWSDAAVPPLYHGYSASEFVKGAVTGTPDPEWLGELWPKDQIAVHGIDWSDPQEDARPSGAPKNTWPNSTGQSPKKTWPHHFGRGAFSPMTPTAVGIPMDDGLALGVDLAANYPHRIGLLGQPIVDCGHRSKEGQYGVEIHPPHLVVMELAQGKGAGGNATEYSVFGWVSSTSGNHLEFDLYPPPRTSAKLMVNGKDQGDGPVALSKQSAAASMMGDYVIDASGPRGGGGTPTLVCTASPPAFPNHVHCEYDHPGSFTIGAEGWVRALPREARSRFEVRMSVGWGFAL